MTPKEFVKLLLPDAEKAQQATGIDALIILAQAALESGWGRYAPGNMYFGVKDSDGLNGNEQLVLTTEYSRRPGLMPKDLGLVDITKVTPVKIAGQPYYKYRGRAYFRKYDAPSESFTDHAKLFLRAKVYSKAMAVKDQPIKFIDEMAKHYATDPQYSTILKQVYSTIKRNA